MHIVDACGRSCPEPVILTKNALASGERECEVLVDNQTALQNVTRFSENAGYNVSVQQDGETYRMQLRKRA